MSLRIRERRALRMIEAGISQSDPGLVRLLDGFNDLATGHVTIGDERRQGPEPWWRSAARLAARGTATAAAAVCAPGVRERLGVRGRPQPMGRATWQRLT